MTEPSDSGAAGKHTPGPWYVLEVMGQKFVAAKPTEDSSSYGHTRHMDIASDEDYPRKDADLKLIAAAPEMAEALNRILVSYAGDDGECAECGAKLGTTPSCESCHVLGSAIEVLKKAGLL